MEDKVVPPETATATTTETVIPTCSVASEMTGNDASVSDFVEQEESSIMDSREKESSKWTNEKHSLYLKSIEASFVDQLYNSLDMPSSQTHNICCWDAISASQFKVLQHGCWSKKSFKSQNSHVKDADRPHVSPGNPWIQHFRSGSHKRRSSTIPDPQLDQDPCCSNTEVMDQNFVEDTSCSRKRVRASKIGHSSNNQC